MYDVIVVGLGAMGSAAAAHAAQRGLRVLGVERFGRVHELGSSGGRSRIIRKAYFEHPAYVPLVSRAYDLWKALERETGLDIVRDTGVLLVGVEDDAALGNARASAQLHGIPFDELSATQIAHRFPRFAPRSGERAIFEAQAGLVIPEAAIEAHLRVAESAGAQLFFDTKIERWQAGRDGSLVVIGANGVRYETRRLAICLGPWFEDIARDVGIPLVVERRVAHWFAPGAAGYGPADIPTFLISRPEWPSLLYGFPDLGDGVKVAFHMLGAAAHADSVDRTVAAADIEPVRAALEAWIPGATQRYLGGKVCLYTLTPDEHFVIGFHPADERIVLAGGFSGHGFKFASAVGEVLADLLTAGGSAHDIGFLSPRRFAAVV